MALLVGELDDFILNRRAVARPNAVDFAGIQRRAVEIPADDVVCLRRRPCQIACVGIVQRAVGHKRERRHWLVAGLGRHFVEINRPHVDARGRPRLEPPERKADARQAAAEVRRAHQPLRPARRDALPDDNLTAEIHAARDHRDLAGDMLPRRCRYAGDMPVLDVNRGNFPLPDGQVVLRHQRGTHPVLVLLLVRLCAQGMNRRAFGHIEHSALEERIVDGAPHFAAHCVQFPHKMPLCAAADNGIARHESDAVHIQRQQEGIKPHARPCEGGFTTRVSAADDYQILHHTPSAPRK